MSFNSRRTIESNKVQEARHTVPASTLQALAAAAPSEKRTIMVALIDHHPQGLVFPCAPYRHGTESHTRGVNLESADLHGIDLARTDLPAAILRKADLREIRLNLADLTDADMAGACLREAVLGEASMQGAMFEDADLQNANLRFADLRSAVLESANLAGADLWGADLEDAMLANANLDEAVLNDAKLGRADLTSVSLKNASLKNADLHGARLAGVNLLGADMKGSSLRDAVLAGARLQEVDLLSCDLTHVYLADAWLERTRCSEEQFGDIIGEELAGDYAGAEKGYLALERNFEGLGDTRAASWAYRRRRRTGKLAAWANARKFFKAHEWALTLKWFVRYASDQFMERLCDYGESIPRVLASMLAVYLVFIVLYKMTGSVVHVYQTPAGITRMRTDNVRDLAIFSLLAMTTSGSPAVGLQPSNEMVYLLTGTEALLGIGFTGLLGFVVGNRIRR